MSRASCTHDRGQGTFGVLFSRKASLGRRPFSHAFLHSEWVFLFKLGPFFRQSGAATLFVLPLLQGPGSRLTPLVAPAAPAIGSVTSTPPTQFPNARPIHPSPP